MDTCSSGTNHAVARPSRLLRPASLPQARKSRRTPETGKRPWMRYPIDLPEVGTTMGPHTLMKAQSASPSDKKRICSHQDKRGLRPLPDESDSPGVRLCVSYLTLGLECNHNGSLLCARVWHAFRRSGQTDIEIREENHTTKRGGACLRASGSAEN